MKPSAPKERIWGDSRAGEMVRECEPFSQLGRYIKYWQKEIIAKCVCVHLFIGMDVPGHYFFPLGATGRITENETDSYLAFTA